MAIGVTDGDGFGVTREWSRGFLAQPSPPHHAVVQLPAEGFTKDDYEAFAAHAGYQFTIATGVDDPKYPGVNERQTPSLRKAIYEQAVQDDRVGSRLRHGLHRMAHHRSAGDDSPT